MTGWVLFWGALAVLFGAGEGLGLTLRLLRFAAAAVAAAGAAWFDAGVALQWTVYAVTAALLSIGAMVAARRLGL